MSVPLCGFTYVMCCVCMSVVVSSIPHQVVMVVAVPSGWVLYITPLRRDERVGSVRWHKQIWNHKCLLDKKSLFQSTDLS